MREVFIVLQRKCNWDERYQPINHSINQSRIYAHLLLTARLRRDNKSNDVETTFLEPTCTIVRLYEFEEYTKLELI